MKKVILLVLIVCGVTGVIYIYYSPKAPFFTKSEINEPQSITKILPQPVTETQPQNHESAIFSVSNENLTAYQCEQEIESWLKEWDKASEEVIGKYQKAIDANPEDAEVHFILGQIYQSVRDKQDMANSQFQRVLQINPNHPKTKIISYWLKRYQEYKTLSIMQKEMDNQQEKIRASGNDPQEYINMARVYKKYNLKPAYTYYKKAIELAPKNEDFLWEVGIFCKSDYYYEAYTCFHKILELAPNHSKKQEITEYLLELEPKVNKQKPLYEKGTVPEEEILACLEHQLKDSSPIQRHQSIERLSQIKSNSSVDLLVKYVSLEDNKELKRSAITAIRGIGTDKAKEVLEAILYEPSDNAIKIDVLLAYLQHGNKKDVEVLEKWVKHDSSRKYRSQGEWVIKEMIRK
jgi:tetratricopeptide (TPR) repeat protein